MKAMQMMMFMFVLFMSFYLVGITGIFINTESLSEQFNWQGILAISLFTTFSVATVTGLLVAKFGINPYTTASYTAFISFFLGSYGGLSVLLIGIANQFGPTVLHVMLAFIAVITAIVILLVFYSLIQMSTGGAKGFE